MNVRKLQNQLLRWFSKNKRDHYPWRYTNNPYHILIAETFLQRTRAEQVLPVYLEFISSFPDPITLAAAHEYSIKDIMYPLGLVWRSKNIRQTAIDIRDMYNGVIPAERNELLKIKGVGEYIADCILYLAFNKRTPIIDANVVRILGRLFGIETHAESRRNIKFRILADEILPKKAFKKFNLALLDLGALVCTRIPKCDICPIKKHCNYFKTETNSNS